jgi:hypothetical protein
MVLATLRELIPAAAGPSRIRRGRQPGGGGRRPPVARISAYGYEELTHGPHSFHTPTVAAVDPAVLSL